MLARCPRSDRRLTALIAIRGDHLARGIEQHLAPGAGARATLPGKIQMFTIGVAADEASAEAIRATLEADEDALRPYHVGYYPNFVEHPAYAGAFFEPYTWTRLREVKTLYDPDDLFRATTTSRRWAEPEPWGRPPLRGPTRVVWPPRFAGRSRAG